MDSLDSIPRSDKAKLSNAIQWLQENPGEKPTTASRIFKVKPEAIRAILFRTKRKHIGAKNKRGGHNKILSASQNDAIQLYCKEQFEGGLGATRSMVYSAISFLKSQEEPPRPPPSWRWFNNWMKHNSNLHTIKTKPIAQNRVDTHSEKDLEEWFGKYHAILDKYNIRKSRNIWNMDESGARVGCPNGEEVIVPIEVKELYTAGPENRKSVTIIEAICADGSTPPPPMIICPGQRIIESWIHDNLLGNEVIAQLPTGYTNEAIAIAWLQYFITFINAGQDKLWKLLLLDGHCTHENPDFVILAYDNHIALLEYPSHLTHVLQLLDVGVFQPWKHYHNQAIHQSMHSLDLEYNITSFFRDLKEIREKTMKSYTIKHVFQDSGMWPISYKIALRKMRQYSTKRTTQAIPISNDSIELFDLPPTTYFQYESRLHEWEERVPDILSSPSARRFQSWAHATKVYLSKVQLQHHEYQLIQHQLIVQSKAKIGNRRSINTGGPINIETARQKKRAKEQREKDEAIRKAQKAIDSDIRKSKLALNRKGIEARKSERERKKLLLELTAKEEFIPLELLVPIRDPEKNPTLAELESLKPHPSLVQALQELQPSAIGLIDPVLLNNDIEFQLELQEELVEKVDNSSDIGSDESDRSIDSIARNADFISFD